MFNMIVIDLCDVLEIEQMVLVILVYEGFVYVCLLCGNVFVVFDEYGYQFELGKVKLLCDGVEVFVILLGIMIMCVLEVVKVLEGDGIGVGVLYVLMIKLFDIEMILCEV